MKISRLNLCTKRTVMLFLAIALASMTLSTSIVVPEDAKLNKGNRSFINPKNREIYSDERKLNRTIPCLVKFVNAFFDLQPYRIPVLLPKNASDTLELARMYLSALQRYVSTYVLSGSLDSTDSSGLSNNHMTTLNGIIMFEDYEELISMPEQLINLCGTDCKYLVVLTKTFPDEESFIAECARLVPVLWARRVANVVFLSAVGSTVLVSRSLKFKPNVICHPDDPVLVGECNENFDWSISKWKAVSNMYSPFVMNNCIVVVAFSDSAPFVTRAKETVTSGSNSENFANETSAIINDTFVELEGIEGNIIKTLASSLKFVISAREIPAMNGTNIPEEVNAVLWDTIEIDVVLGGLTWATANETMYTLPYDVVQIVWLIPVLPNLSLEGLVTPLANDVWFAVIGLLIFAFCMEFILTRNVSFLEIFSLVIGVAWPKQPSILSSRIRFMSWVIFGYLLTQFYLASLAGQLLANSGSPMNSLAELADSSFDIGGTDDTAELFKFEEIEDDPEDIIDNEISRIITSRFKVMDHREYRQSFNDLMDEKNDNLALAVRMNISSMKPSFHDKHVHRMKEALASYPLSFAVWRGIPFLNRMDKKISNLVEGGIIAYWARHISFKDGGYFTAESSDDENFLNLRSMVPGFLLLVMGYGLGGLTLLIEIAVFHWHNRKRTKIKTVNGRMNEKIKRMPPKINKISPAAKMDRRVVRKLPDVMDTKAWIELLNNRREYRTPIRRQGERKVNFPFEFVH